MYAVQLLCPGAQPSIATSPHVRDNLGRDPLGLHIASVARSKQLLLHGCSESQDPHQSTILFRGYSTIPWAFAALSLGKICRTTDSSTIVLTATQPGSLSIEIVGFFRAGSMAITRAKSSRRQFRIRPTLLAAAMAPCSIKIRLSAFSFFHSFAAAARFIMKTVADSKTVSTMRRRLARSEEPVSVTSTMASASCGNFNSVEPQ